MDKKHFYEVIVEWTGNKGVGTKAYQAYERSHVIRVKNKADILGSSDPAFMGDPTKHNPEEMLVSSLSTCHMLWYPHLCASTGVIVTKYLDSAEGIMAETDQGGHFLEVTLKPEVEVLDDSMLREANSLHSDANKHCFIANSVNFPVRHKATTRVRK